jgi:hypothetical protein
MSEIKMPLSKALLWILGSTLLISGTAFMGWLYFLHLKERRLQDDQYRIVALVQSTTQIDSLKSTYLAEVLGLSVDRPVNLYQFNVKDGVNALLTNDLIKEASIRKILPGALLIHYEMRNPIAHLGEFTNTFIDPEGILFPSHPFFTPKRLPIFILGLKEGEWKWGSSLRDERGLNLAKIILAQFKHLKQEKFRVKQLDVSQAFADSFGQRQVVMVLEGMESNLTSSSRSELFLRLSPDDTKQELANFETLRKELFENKSGEHDIDWIDLRIPHLAYIKRKK